MTVTVIRSVIIYFTVVLAVRIMGRRQIGELSTHEFVITILISAVATVPLEDNEIPLANSLLPIFILISLEIIQSAFSLKSEKFRILFEGKPIIIIKNGKLIQGEMSRLRLTINDIIDNLRQQSIFDISQVKNAVVEANGKISVQKTDDKSPFTTPVICDGKAVSEYFLKNNISEDEINVLLKKNGLDGEKLMLLTVDENKNVFYIKRDDEV